MTQLTAALRSFFVTNRNSGDVTRDSDEEDGVGGNNWQNIRYVICLC